MWTHPHQSCYRLLGCLLPILVDIINSSIHSGIVPKPLKTAVIKPVLKKNGLNLNLCKIYHPVLNLPYVSKLLERIIAERLLSHLNQHDLLDNFRSAYCQGHGCETAILHVLNDVLCSADGGDLVLLVLLDLSVCI